MKRLLLMITMCLPLMLMAQNAWEAPENESGEKVNPDEKYLAGAVPVVDGRVMFETTIDAPGKSAKEIYTLVLDYLTALSKEEGQFEQSGIKATDEEAGNIVAQYQETLIFKSTALVYDHTFFAYTIMANCYDGKLDVKMTRIYYIYPPEGDQPQKLVAEDTITDDYALAKKGKKLSRVYGRFRRKTVDRKDYIFNKLQALVTK